MSQDVMICVMNSTAVFDDVNVKIQNSESCVKCLDLDVELLKSQNAYNDLSTKYFKNNDLKAQLQAKDTTICKLKKHIKAMIENVKEEKVKHKMDEIETINIELEHSVAKLLYENERLHKEIEHLKKIYKDQFDSIKKTRALSKEHCDSLIAQLNSKSMENSDLKGQIHEKVFVTTALQSELRRLKGKHVLDNATTITNATTIAPRMFKLDIEPLSHRLKNNRDAHEDYLKKTIENTDTIRGLVERARKQNPGEPLLDFACKFTKHVQELLVYVSQTYPNFTKPSKKLVDVIPMNKVKKVRFSEPLTSSSNIHKQVESSKTSNSNTPVLSSTGLKCSTSTCRSQPTSETQKPEIKVYSRRPKQGKSVGSSKKAKIEESKIANNSEPTHLWGSNATNVPSSSSLVNDRFPGTVRFRNDQVAKIMGYGDYQLGNVIISRVYYVEGLGQNLFSVGQFCDTDLEVAIRKNTCFIQNLEGVDLLSGSRDTNLYTISLDDMLKTSPICLLSKASKTKSWLWHC
ncbi:hypothetical protein Tco_0876443 [Tanacetum coccineum]|uniref:Integrase, catalytic region, zinc finger, CCHC-type, peptidase aspartic, catalytic n=1 Tax=Tanacetum coccineum TaxID=301880 RepID=A0ABQ5BV24_9ASTR